MAPLQKIPGYAPAYKVKILNKLINFSIFYILKKIFLAINLYLRFKIFFYNYKFL
jgi:hypothetical protein